MAITVTLNTSAPGSNPGLGASLIGGHGFKPHLLGRPQSHACNGWTKNHPTVRRQDTQGYVGIWLVGVRSTHNGVLSYISPARQLKLPEGANT